MIIYANICLKWKNFKDYKIFKLGKYNTVFTLCYVIISLLATGFLTASNDQRIEPNISLQFTNMIVALVF